MVETTALSQGLELRWFSKGGGAAIADVYHVVRNSAGGSINTPAGWLAIVTRPALPECAKHLEAMLTFRAYALDHCKIDPEKAADDVLAVVQTLTDKPD